MAKNNDTEQERMEQEFHEHLNANVQSRAKELTEKMNSAFAKAAESAAKRRKRIIAHEVTRCGLAVACIVFTYFALKAELIAPVLTVPIYAAAVFSCGWHVSKLDSRRGRKQ